MSLPPSRLVIAWSSCLALSFAPLIQAQNNVFTTIAQVTGATTSTQDVSKLKHYVITDYGAVPDGKTLNTAFIQKAIDAAAAAGGGVLEIPKGTFLSGSIFLKQGVDLFLDEGAVLLGSQNIDDYPKQMTRIEGHFEPWRVALVNVWNMSHVRIGGTGQLNGNGAPFWNDFYSRRAANPATTNLDVERARLMFVDHCDDVRIEDISFQDSQFWNLHLYHSHDVLVSHLRINAASALTGGRSPSTDGIDVDSCQNITIQSCQISNNDDDIALKGSKGPHADLLTDNPPDENILIQNCTIGDGNGLLTCGSEATIVHNVLVRNCSIYGSAKMLTLKLRPDTPQHYSNITLDGITLNGTGSMINVAPWTQFFDLQGQPGPARSLDHIVVRNITGSFGSFGSIRGNVANPQRGTLGDSISDFTIENINVSLRTPGFSRGEVDNFVFKNVIVNGQPVTAPTASISGLGRRGGNNGAATPPAATSAPPTTSAP
jgi:alpha-L-rhamnosidase